MPQSLSQIYIHLVFSTKRRVPWLRDREICVQLYAYMAALFRDKTDSPAIIINGTEDHVHSLIRLSRRFAIMKVVQQAKTESCKWLKKQLKRGPAFAWQVGYGAFSVSVSSVDDVKEYIRNQLKHHEKMSFQEEFRKLCERHGLELDEKYAWD